MKIRTDKFRCDLCGEYRKLGVTESHPLHDESEGDDSTQTSLCSICVVRATQCMLDYAEED